jgi:hypothetical protein
MGALQPGGTAVRNRQVVAMLLARALLGLLSLLAAIASHAGGTCPDGVTREKVFPTFREPNPHLAVAFDLLALPFLGRLTSWSRS